MTSRYWCFTVNNPDASDIALLQCPTNVRFLAAVMETGEEGTPHYQGYLELDRHRRLSFVKKILPRAHLEVRRGTAIQALTYCLKTLTEEQRSHLTTLQPGTYMSDSQNTPGLPPIIIMSTDARSVNAILSESKPDKETKEQKLQRLKDAIDEGKSEKQLAEIDFPLFLQHYKGLQHYRMLSTSPRSSEVEVIVIIGKTGVGKSRYCFENYPDAYWKQRSAWWCNYSGQSEIVIDEFYGWLPFDQLLRICDRYPLLVETKGGQVQFLGTKIILTSNVAPERWYKNVYFNAFSRRVTSWMIYPSWGEPLLHTSYANALPDILEHSADIC